DGGHGEVRAAKQVKKERGKGSGAMVTLSFFLFPLSFCVVRRLLIAAALLGLLGLGGGFWYQSTRPDKLLRRGQQALDRGEVEQAELLATRLDSGGHKD